MTGKQLSTLVEEWVDRLELSHWDINVKFTPVFKMDDDACARSAIDANHLKARIEIMPDTQLDPDAPHYQTTEHLVVHELLHVRLFPDGITEGTAACLALEQGINTLAKLLIQLYADEAE